MAPDRVVLQFVEAINRHQTEALLDLMTDDHLFVDAAGDAIRGRSQLHAAWQRYFQMVPDYRIEVLKTFTKADEVALFGVARGTCIAAGEGRAENRWQIPAAWWARVQQEKIAHWQVYADNEAVRRILARIGTPGSE